MVEQMMVRNDGIHNLIRLPDYEMPQTSKLKQESHLMGEKTW